MQGSCVTLYINKDNVQTRDIHKFTQANGFISSTDARKHSSVNVCAFRQQQWLFDGFDISSEVSLTAETRVYLLYVCKKTASLLHCALASS